MSFAKASLSGTVTSDPEKRFTPNNHAVSSFNMDVEMVSGGNRPGGNEPFTVKITCWRNLAEAVTTQLSKGDSVLVEGKLIINSFQTPEGIQKKLFELEANTIDKLPGKPEPVMSAGEGGQTAAPRAATPSYDTGYASAPQQAAPAGAASSGHFSSEDLLTEDDIPF